jgi:hypothetical protein
VLEGSVVKEIKNALLGSARYRYEFVMDTKNVRGDCLSDLLLLDAGPVDLLKCDGFLAKTLIYIPSATICRQGKETPA